MLSKFDIINTLLDSALLCGQPTNSHITHRTFDDLSITIVQYSFSQASSARTDRQTCQKCSATKKRNTVLCNEKISYVIYTLNWPIALVSSRFAFNIENLNFARTSVLLHDTRSRYSDRYSLLSSSSPFGFTLKHLETYSCRLYNSALKSIFTKNGFKHSCHYIQITNNCHSAL